METIVLHVTYTCKAGEAEAFVSAIRAQGLQEMVKAEDGCLQYDYHLSLEQEDTVVLLEHWQTAAALEQHLAQPHITTLRALKEQYVTNTTLERFA